MTTTSRRVTVGEIMTPVRFSITRTATVQDAIRKMRENMVSSLVVERRDHYDEFGIITATDIARDVLATGRAPERVNVYEVMTKPVLTVAMEMDVKYAVRLLIKFGPSRAIVMDSDRRPTGIITIRDLVLKHMDDTT